MHDRSGFDFTQFVPGLDFLKNMGTGHAATGATTPSWVAPTLDPAELDKRMQELKTVHFWLDQNTKAVSATIQALEVQRMTLSALHNMNVSFGDMAEALKVKPHAHKAHDDKPSHAETASEEAAAQPAKKTAKKSTRAFKAKAAPAGVDPSQWWGALTQQFQNIANTAMQEMSKNAETHPGAPSAKAAATKAAANATHAAATAKAASGSAKKRSAKTGASKAGTSKARR